MEEAFDAFSISLARTGKINELERKFIHYKNNGSEEDMFKYIYNLKESHQFLKTPKTKASKNKCLSAKLREEGNVFFKRKMYKEALEKYNECIFSAPHPDMLNANIDENQYDLLSLGYGNRSAILFQLKEYEICVCDIDHSLKFCNSKNTQFKLKERKLKCLIAMNKYNEAHELLKHCKTLLNTLELDEKVKECYKSSLSKLNQQCSDGIKSGLLQNITKQSRYEEVNNTATSSPISTNDLIFAYTNPNPPSLDDEPNPAIPAFSCALKPQYSPDQGRYVVATRNIKPGEVIAVEKAYVSCVKPEEPNSPLSFCTFCLARCAAPLPCFECNNVVFCSEECRSEGWDKFHRIECPVYPQLQELEIDLIQSYRMIAGQTLDELKAFVSHIQDDKHKFPLEQIVNEDQICKSDSYKGMYYLEGNMKTTETDKLINFSIKAFMYTQLLIHSNRYFHINKGVSQVPDEGDIILIGSLFIRHFLGVGCNSFDISEIKVIPNENKYSEEVTIGSGTYIAGSLFNHSCFPSVTLFPYGNTGVFRACRFIPSGSQVCICYAQMYYGQPDREIRRKYFSDDSYSFICNCEICVSNFKFSLQDINDIFTCTRLRAKHKRIPRNDFDETSSLKLELDNLVERNYSMTKMLFSPKFDVRGYLDLTLESIEFFDRFVVIPNPLYIHLTIIFEEILRRDRCCYFISKTKHTPVLNLRNFHFYLRLVFISNFQYPSKSQNFKEYENFLKKLS